MKTETWTCPMCEVDLETTAAGIAGHQKKCRKARGWERDYFRERGKWPSSKANRSSFVAGGGSRRGGRLPGNSNYDM